MNRTKHTKKAVLLGCLVAALLLPAAASAQQPTAAPGQTPATGLTQEPLQFSQRTELFFELRAPTFYTTDPTFDAVGEDDTYSGGYLGAGLDLGEYALPGLRGMLIYHSGGNSLDRFNGDLEVDWGRNLFMLSADYGPELWGVFRPSVRLGAGYALQHLQVDTTGAAKDDFAHDLAGMGSVGLELFTPRGLLGSVSLGFIGEFGYLMQTNASFDELEAGRGDEWTYEEARLGELDTDGIFWDLGVSLRVGI